MKAITNKKIILDSISEAIIDLKKLTQRPSLTSASKKIRSKMGIKIYTGKSLICLTDNDGKKPCESNPTKCIFSTGKCFGCRTLKTYVSKENRKDIKYLEMQYTFLKRVKSFLKNLNKEMFLKKNIPDLQLFVNDESERVYITYFRKIKNN